MKNDLITWFKENNYRTIADTGLNWKEVGIKFNLTTEQARHTWRNEIKTNENLTLKSKWQVQTKGGGTVWLESYTNSPFSIDINDIKDVISSIELKPVKYDPFEKLDSTTSLIVYLSDEHIGACVKDALYPNEYTADEFESRIQKVYKYIVELITKVGYLDNLIICNLADSVDNFLGQTQRGGPHLPTNMNSKEIFNTYISVHYNFLVSLLNAKISNNIRYVAVSDCNHAGDIEYMHHKAFQYYIEASKLPIEVTVMEKFMDHFILGNKCFILTHGKDKALRKYGMPFKLNPETEVLIEQYIRYNNLTDYEVSVIKGDLHNSLSETSKFFRYRNVGSLFGSSDYIMINYGNTSAKCEYDLILNDSILEGCITLNKTI